MKVLFMGDIAFSYVKEHFLGEEAVKKQIAPLVPVLDSADIRMVNLENILSDTTCEPIIKSGPPLCCGTEFACYLRELKIDVASLANNHTGDYGEAGIKSTLDCLNKNGIAYVGAGANIDEAYRAFRYEKDGVKISIIACCENEFGVAGEDSSGSAGYELGRVASAVHNEKKISDFVLFHFHGGNEENPFPSPRKVELYRHITDIGADAVIAMHTHCPQGYEIHNGKPIVYSMGNFFFPRPENESAFPMNSAWYFGYMSMLDITKNGIELQIYPYRFGEYKEKIKLFEGAQKDRFLSYLDELSDPISDRLRIKDLFNIWSTIGGNAYSFTLEFNEAMKKKGGSALVCHLRNSFVCEAHSEMLANFTELCYQERVEEFALRQDEILKYSILDLQ